MMPFRFRSFRVNKPTLLSVYVVAIIAVIAFSLYTRIPSSYIKTSGTVVVAPVGGTRFRSEETISFISKNGQNVTFKWQEYAGSSTYKGETIPVYYNPSNPQQAKVKTNKSDYVIIYGVIVAFIVVISAVSLWPRKSNKH